MIPSLVLFSFILHWHISSLSKQFSSRGKENNLKTNFINTTTPSNTTVRQIKQNYFQGMKRKGIKKPIMPWSVIYHAKPCKKKPRRCNLCLTEKYHILTITITLITKGLSSFQNVIMKTSFTLLKWQFVALVTHQTQTLPKISAFKLCESLVLFENRKLWLETWSRKIVSFG